MHIHGRSRAAPSPLVLPSTIVIADIRGVKFGIQARAIWLVWYCGGTHRLLHIASGCALGTPLEREGGTYGFGDERQRARRPAEPQSLSGTARQRLRLPSPIERCQARASFLLFSLGYLYNGIPKRDRPDCLIAQWEQMILLTISLRNALRS